MPLGTYAMRLRELPRLFADETTAARTNPGRGRTKTVSLWLCGR
jgi:transposase